MVVGAGDAETPENKSCETKRSMDQVEGNQRTSRTGNSGRYTPQLHIHQYSTFRFIRLPYTRNEVRLVGPPTTGYRARPLVHPFDLGLPSLLLLLSLGSRSGG